MGLFCSSLPQLDPSQLSSAAPHRYLRGRSREGRAGTCGSFQQLPTAFANGWMRGSMNCMPNSDGSLRTSPPSRAPRYGRAASPRRGRRWCRCCRCMPKLWVKSPAQHGAVPTILCSRSAHLAGLAWPLQLEGKQSRRNHRVYSPAGFRQVGSWIDLPDISGTIVFGGSLSLAAGSTWCMTPPIMAATPPPDSLTQAPPIPQYGNA